MGTCSLALESCNAARKVAVKSPAQNAYTNYPAGPCKTEILGVVMTM